MLNNLLKITKVVKEARQRCKSRLTFQCPFPQSLLMKVFCHNHRIIWKQRGYVTISLAKALQQHVCQDPNTYKGSVLALMLCSCHLECFIFKLGFLHFFVLSTCKLHNWFCPWQLTVIKLKRDSWCPLFALLKNLTKLSQ